MDEVERIEKEMDIKKLKEALSEKTLVGEFVGYPTHQHLVTYPAISLYFFSLTDHAKDFTAVDPLITMSIIKEFKLKGVRIESLGVYNELKELKTRLIQDYIEMAQGSMSCEEEGVVLYFVQRSKVIDNDFTLCLCKSKTIEYNIYRLLREILREFFTDVGGSGKPAKEITSERFYAEVQTMVKTWFGKLDYKKYKASPELFTPKPLWYYKQLGDKVFQYIAKLPDKDSIRKIVKEKFAEFIEMFSDSLDTDVLVNYLQEVDTKCTIIITPPFLYYELEDTRPVTTIADIMWKTVKGPVIYLIRVPGIQVKWKKHKEVLKRHTFIVYNRWEDFEEYRKVIETREGGTDEEEKMKEYDDYQQLKVWSKSRQNMQLLKNANNEGGYNLFFVNNKDEYTKVI